MQQEEIEERHILNKGHCDPDEVGRSNPHVSIGDCFVASLLAMTTS